MHQKSLPGSLAASAVAAVAAMPMLVGAAAPQPLTFTVAPGSVMVATGQHHYVEHLTVSNNSRVPVKVANATVLLTPGTCSAGSVPWASVSPRSEVLQPDRHATVTFAASAPASMRGTQDVAAEFTARSANVKAGDVAVSGTIASRVVLRLSGRTTSMPDCSRAPRPHAVAASTHGSNLAEPVVLVVLLAGLVTLLWRAIARRRARGGGGGGAAG